MSNFCSNCGTKLEQGSSLCIGCGKPVGEIQHATSTRSLVIGGGIVVALAIVVIGFFILTGKSRQGSSAEETTRVTDSGLSGVGHHRLTEDRAIEAIIRTARRQFEAVSEDVMRQRLKRSFEVTDISVSGDHGNVELRNNQDHQILRLGYDATGGSWEWSAVDGQSVEDANQFLLRIYDLLNEKREEVRRGWSQVENVMHRRADLIPNLVNTVKGITKQEFAVFSRITDARSKLLSPTARPEERIRASEEIAQFRVQMLSLAQQYTELRANETFNRLMDELAGTENRIAVARRDYVHAVQRYNQLLSHIEYLLVAEIAGLQPMENFFTHKPSTREAPKVSF